MPAHSLTDELWTLIIFTSDHSLHWFLYSRVFFSCCLKYEWLIHWKRVLPLAHECASEYIFKIFTHKNYFYFATRKKSPPTATFSRMIAPWLKLDQTALDQIVLLCISFYMSPWIRCFVGVGPRCAFRFNFKIVEFLGLALIELIWKCPKNQRFWN